MSTLWIKKEKKKKINLLLSLPFSLPLKLHLIEQFECLSHYHTEEERRRLSGVVKEEKKEEEHLYDTTEICRREDYHHDSKMTWGREDTDSPF